MDIFTCERTNAGFFKGMLTSAFYCHLLLHVILSDFFWYLVCVWWTIGGKQLTELGSGAKHIFFKIEADSYARGVRHRQERLEWKAISKCPLHSGQVKILDVSIFCMDSTTSLSAFTMSKTVCLSPALNLKGMRGASSIGRESSQLCSLPQWRNDHFWLCLTV